jgi:hypothetical protein
MARRVQVVFDCADPDAQASFWAHALGYEVQPPPPGFDDWETFLRTHGMEDRLGEASAIVDPDGAGPRIYFQRVPEPKLSKNRVHLDINVLVSNGLSPEQRHARLGAVAEDLVSQGATVIRTVDEDRGEYWVVMADPEGNEFCLQ